MKKSLAVYTLVGAIGLGSVSVNAETWAMAILDSSSSMNVLRSDGITRCEFGKRKMLNYISIALDHNVSYLNVTSFNGNPDINMNTLTEGFRDVKGFTSTNLQGTAFLKEMENKLEVLSCSGTTPLGDAICLSADELREQSKENDRLRLLVLTAGGENSSKICGGANYIQEHIIPKITANPIIGFSIPLLTQGDFGHELSSSAVSQQHSMEEFDYPEYYESGAASSKMARHLPLQDEIRQLISVSILSGGEDNMVAPDDQDCLMDCSSGGDDWNRY